MVATDMPRSTGLPQASSDIVESPEQPVADSAVQPTVDRGEGISLGDASVTAGAVERTAAIAIIPAASSAASPEVTVPVLTRFMDGASHLIRSVADGEYRRATAREPHIETLHGDGPLGPKISAAVALGKLIKGISEQEAESPSASRAIAELKLVMTNPALDWRLRSTALLSLRQQNEVKGEPTPAFARELAVSLLGEKQNGMRLSLLDALSHSRDPMVQEVLLETLKDPEAMIAALAGEALKTSYGLRYSSELEGKLMAKVSAVEWMDPTGHEQEREAALNVLSARVHKPHFEVVADIIKDPSEPASLRGKALALYGRSSNPIIREALLDLAAQDESTALYPSLLDTARQLLAETEPKLVIMTEAERRVELSHYAA